MGSRKSWSLLGYGVVVCSFVLELPSFRNRSFPSFMHSREFELLRLTEFVRSRIIQLRCVMILSQCTITSVSSMHFAKQRGLRFFHQERLNIQLCSLPRESDTVAVLYPLPADFPAEPFLAQISILCFRIRASTAKRRCCLTPELGSRLLRAWCAFSPTLAWLSLTRDPTIQRISVLLSCSSAWPI